MAACASYWPPWPPLSPSPPAPPRATRDRKTDAVADTVAACQQYLEDFAGDSSQLTEEGVRELSTQAQDETVQNALSEAADLLPGLSTPDRTMALQRGQTVCNMYLQRNPATG